MASVRRDAYAAEDVQFGTLAANQFTVAMDDAINFREAQRARDSESTNSASSNRDAGFGSTRSSPEELERVPKSITAAVAISSFLDD